MKFINYIMNYLINIKLFNYNKLFKLFKRYINIIMFYTSEI